MELSEAIAKRRTIRRFKQIPVDDQTLLALIECACLAPSAANLQVLRYQVVRTPEIREKLLSLTQWAGYVRPARTPVPGVTGPAAFLVLTAPKEASGEFSRNTLVDSGAAAEAILLKATDLGLGGCWIGAFDREKTDALLGLKEQSAVYLIALGFPDEDPVAERIGDDGNVRYWLDGNDRLHVPKHTAESVTRFR